MVNETPCPSTLKRKQGPREILGKQVAIFQKVRGRLYLKCRKNLPLPPFFWPRCIPEQEFSFYFCFSFFLTWVMQSFPNHRTRYHIHVDLCHVSPLVFRSVCVRQLFPKVFAMKTNLVWRLWEVLQDRTFFNII